MTWAQHWPKTVKSSWLTPVKFLISLFIILIMLFHNIFQLTYYSKSYHMVSYHICNSYFTSARWIWEIISYPTSASRIIGRDPFNHNFRKFRSKTQWIGSVQPSFEKTGSPFEVDHFSRSGRLEFWLNGSRPLFYFKKHKISRILSDFICKNNRFSPCFYFEQ